jgi:hypothetical protein
LIGLGHGTPGRIEAARPQATATLNVAAALGVLPAEQQDRASPTGRSQVASDPGRPRHTTHYSMLRTTEQLLGLGFLGSAAGAAGMRSAFNL